MQQKILGSTGEIKSSSLERHRVENVNKFKDLHIDTEELEAFDPPGNALDVLNSLQAAKQEKEEEKSLTPLKSSMSERKFLAEARVLKGISRYIEVKDDHTVEI